MLLTLVDQLPTGLDILQHIAFNKSTLSKTSKKSMIIACSVKKDRKYERCVELHCRCILSKIKGLWLKAGFPLQSDNNLIQKLNKLNKKYLNLKKNMHRRSPLELKKQQDFRKKLGKIFWAGIADLQNWIKKDKNRSDLDRKEDLDFLYDQEHNRKLFLGPEDKKYSEKVLYIII